MLQRTLASLGRMVVLFGAVALFGCASVTVPPVSSPPSESWHYGKVVWHDLVTADVTTAKRFYGELFGWEFEEDVSDAYTVIRNRGRRIGGIVHGDPEKRKGKSSYWIPSVSVADADRAATAIGAAGGRVIDGPDDLPDRGRTAVVADPEGGVFGILRSSGGDPPDVEASENGWLWHEIVTRDRQAARSFYSAALGYQMELVGSEHDYAVLKRDGVARVGLVDNPFEDTPAFWIPYVRVRDPATLAGRVSALGGNVVLAPEADLRGGSVAVIQDPSGAPLALQKWPIETEERTP